MMFFSSSLFAVGYVESVLRSLRFLWYDSFYLQTVTYTSGEKRASLPMCNGHMQAFKAIGGVIHYVIKCCLLC